jgi:hypothetical protein
VSSAGRRRYWCDVLCRFVVAQEVEANRAICVAIHASTCPRDISILGELEKPAIGATAWSLRSCLHAAYRIDATKFDHSLSSKIPKHPRLERFFSAPAARRGPAATPRPLSSALQLQARQETGSQGGAAAPARIWLCSLSPPAASGRVASAVLLLVLLVLRIEIRESSVYPGTPNTVRCL